MAATIAPYKSTGGPPSIDAIVIDVVSSEVHTYANTVTDHPVEQGSNITDHSRPEPDGVVMECIITNTPLSRKQATHGVQSGAFQFSSTSTGAVKLGDASGLAQNAYQQLLKLRNEGTLVDVVTNLTMYKSMAITNLSVPRDKTTTDMLKFSITFKKVRVVQNKLTRVANSKDSRTGGKVKTGAKTTTEEGPKELKSSLQGMVDGDNSTVNAVGKFVGGIF